MGMLDGLNMSALDPELLKWLQAAQGQTEDRKGPLSQGLMAAGLGMLANSHKGFAGAAGEGGLLGLNTWQQGMAAQKKDPMAQLAMLNSIMGLNEKMQGQRKTADQEAAYKRVVGEPITGPKPADNAPDFMGPPSAPPPVSKYEQYLGVAEKLLQSNLPGADKYFALAEKFKPVEKKVKSQTTVTDPKTGERVLANLYEDGSMSPVGYNPDKEKFITTDAGGAIYGLDPFTGEKRVEIPKTNTPDATLSDTRSREQFGITDQRAREQMRQMWGIAEAGRNQSERHFQANQNAPQIISNEAGTFAVNKQTGTARPVTGEDGKPFANEKPLTEAQARVFMAGSRVEQAGKILSDLESDPGFSATALTNKLANAPYPIKAASSKKAQKYAQAIQDWSEAELRLKSGAVITNDEIEANKIIYFPQPGDSAEVVAQKAAARRNVEQSMRVMMGKGAAGKLEAKSPQSDAQAKIEAEMRKRGLLK